MSRPIVVLVDDQLGADAVLLQAAFDQARSVSAQLAAGRAEIAKPAPSALVDLLAIPGQRDVGGTRVNDADGVVQYLGEFGAMPIALVLLDMRFDSGPLDLDGRPSGRASDTEFGRILLEKIRAHWPSLPAAFLSTYGQQELGQAAALPYLSKSEITDHAFAVLLLRHARLTQEQRAVLLGLRDEVVVAETTVRAYQEAFEVAPLNVAVMITGETGTGKEVLARYTHRRSSRSDGPFVAVNVNAIPRDLFEAAFFGHMRGAFTGAVEDRPGYFEQADGGTLFLDEIGELAPDLQVKLLRALETNVVRRLGGKADVPVDVRLIAATNRADVDGAITDLRDDLQFRLRGYSIHLEPLRARREDIPILAAAMCQDAQKAFGRSGISLSTSALDALLCAELPGNARELRQRVTSAVARTGSNSLVTATMLGSFRAPAARDEQQAEVEGGVPATRASELPTAPLPSAVLKDWLAFAQDVRVPPDVDILRGVKPALDEAVDRLNLRLAVAALQATRKPTSGDFVVTAAAQVLYDDMSLKGNVPARRIAAMLGLPQTQGLTQAQLFDATVAAHDRPSSTTRDGKEAGESDNDDVTSQ